MVKNFDGQALDVSAPFLELCKSKKIVQKQPEQFGKRIIPIATGCQMWYPMCSLEVLHGREATGWDVSGVR